jgi:hypothetical protein
MHAPDDLALIWKRLASDRRKLDGSKKLIQIRRSGNLVWVPLAELTIGEFSLELGGAKALEARAKRSQRRTAWTNRR